MTAAALLIARHGEAHCNREQFIGGPRGCRGLTRLGREQAALLSTRLAAATDQPVDVLYASPLRRTRETAGIVGDRLGLDVLIDNDLAEQDYGTGDGRPWADVVADFGGIPALEPDRPLAPGGETWRQYLARSRAALQRILTRHPGQHVLIVGHGETVDTAFRLFLNLPADSRASSSVAVHHTSLTAWSRQPVSQFRPDAGRRWELRVHNDICHLH